jgi:thiol-disulfide isomerase/thioredoxin
MKMVVWLFLAMYMFVGCVVDEPGESSGDIDLVGVGDRLPSFSVEVVDNDARYTFSSDALIGRTVIVFFNTTCSDCQRELPVLNDYYLQHRSEPGFQMVAIAREETEESIQAFWQSHSLSIPYSPQDDRRVFNLFATATIPRVYFCEKTGEIIWVGIERFILPNN